MKLNKISADMVSRRPDQTAEWLNRLARQVDIVESEALAGSKKPGDLPIATTYSLGVVKIGQNLSITPEGVLSALAPTSYNYELLFNKPKINNVELIGNKSLSDLGIDIPTKTSELQNDGSDGTSTYVEADELATVATSGSYTDLINKPTIGNATLTIQKNSTNVGTFTANATTNQIIDISVPTQTSDIINNGADGTSTYVEADELATVATSGSYADLLNKPTIGNATLTIQKNATDIDTFTANATSNKTINITVPTTAADVGALPDSTKYAANLSLTIDSSTFVVTGQLKDQDGNNIGNSQTIDLPLESVVVNGSYDSATKEVVLTLENGNTIRFSVADLVSGLQTEITSNNPLNADLVDDSTSTNKFVTSSDITTWNGKQDALTAGSNIQINGTTISATDTTYSAGSGLDLTGTTFSVDTTTIQPKLTAGDGINIASNIISVTDPAPSGYWTNPATVTGQGTSITLNNTLNAEILDFKGYGDTTQDTLTGKNLFDRANATEDVLYKWADGLPNSDTGSLVGTNYITTTGGDNFASNYAMTPFFYDSSNTYLGTLTSNGTVEKLSGVYVNTFTVPSGYNVAKMRVEFRKGYNGNPNDMTTVTGIMVNTGATAAPYEPYVGGIPSPNPDYPQAVNTVTGRQTVKIVPEQKNIADPQTFIDWVYRTDGVCVKNGWGTSANRPTYGEYQGRSHVVRFPSDLLYSIRTTMVDPTYDEARLVYQNIFKENTRYTISMDIVCTSAAGYVNLAVLYTDGTTKAFPSTGTQNTWTPLTLTTDAGKTVKGMRVVYSSGTNYIDLDTLQIEEGTTKTAYTPFVGQSYEINLGKNLFNESEATISNGYVRDSQAQFVVASGNKNRTIIMRCLPNTTYTISKTGGDRFNVFTANQIYSSGTNNISNLIRGTLQADTQPASQTIATGSDTYLYIHICSNYETYDINQIMATLQVEYGNEPTTYSAYFTPIELCKIGTYQDYIYRANGNWYKHAEVGKVVLTGAVIENWQKASTTGRDVYYTDTISDYSRSDNIPISDHFVGVVNVAGASASALTNNHIAFGSSSLGTQNRFYVRYDGMWATTSDFNTWLSTNTPTVYYALDTATDTEITNAELLADLNALADANMMDGQTNIMVASVSPNLPIILQVQAYQSSSAGVEAQIASKQDALKAGANIQIVGDTISATDTTYSTFTGADSGTAGTDGLVPAPAAGDNTKYLSGDGTWKTVSQYSLPIATANDLGGIKVGSRLTINSTTGVLSADSQTDNNFTTTLKNKLDGIASGAEVNVQSDWTEASNTSDAYIKNKPSLATVATSGSYNDLSNKPTIPTVNNATLTIQRNGSDLQTFTANSSTNKTADIQAPARVDLTSTTQMSAYRRSVIALCKVSTANNVELNSFSSGEITLHRNNGLDGVAFIDVYIENAYYGAYAFNFSYTSNVQLLSSSAAIDTATGFRPCVFKKDNVWYAGVEFYLAAAQYTNVYFNGETNFNIFGLDYYRVPYTSSGTTYPAEVLDQEVYDSIDYTTVTWKKDALMTKSLRLEDGTIKKGGSYTATLPNKTGTLAMTSDLPTVNNATLTIQKNSTNVATFTANASSNVTANISVPTKTSDLTNDSGFITDTSSQSFAAQEGSTNPVFDDMTPLSSFEWDVSDTTYRPVYQMENTGWTYDNMDVTVAYRITVTGSSIKSVTDVIDRWYTLNNWPVTSLMHRTLSTSAGTTGLRYLRAVYPTSGYVNNNTYKFGQEIAMYNSTARHVLVEVFKTSSKVTWNTTKPSASIYKGSSTYQSTSAMEPYTTRGWHLRKPSVFTATNADQATCITDYERVTVGSSVIKSGATALVAGHFAFLAEDGLVYDISNTAKAISMAGTKIGWISSGINANTAISQSYWRAISRPNATQYGYFGHDTMALGDRVYLRCTMDSSGKIHSDNYLSKTMSAGYTWMPMGFMTAATTFYADTRFPMFYTLNSAGKLTHINGQETAPDITVTNTDPGEGVSLGEDEYIAVYGASVQNPDFTLTNVDPGEGVALGADEYIGVYGSPNGIQPDELDWTSFQDTYKSCSAVTFTSPGTAYQASYPSGWSMTINTTPNAVYWVEVHTVYLVCDSDPSKELDLEVEVQSGASGATTTAEGKSLMTGGHGMSRDAFVRFRASGASATVRAVVSAQATSQTIKLYGGFIRAHRVA